MSLGLVQGERQGERQLIPERKAGGRMQAGYSSTVEANTALGARHKRDQENSAVSMGHGQLPHGAWCQQVAADHAPSGGDGGADPSPPRPFHGSEAANCMANARRDQRLQEINELNANTRLDSRPYRNTEMSGNYDFYNANRATINFNGARDNVVFPVSSFTEMPLDFDSQHFRLNSGMSIPTAAATAKPAQQQQQQLMARVGSKEAQKHGSPPAVGKAALDSKELECIFFKTRKCQFFAHGVCSKGATCNFAHSERELRPLPDLSCTKMCPNMLRAGKCHERGCKYAHTRDDVRKISAKPQHHERDDVRKISAKPQHHERGIHTKLQNKPLEKKHCDAPWPEKTKEEAVAQTMSLTRDSFVSMSTDAFSSPSSNSLASFPPNANPPTLGQWRRQLSEGCTPIGDEIVLGKKDLSPALCLTVKRTFIDIEEGAESPRGGMRRVNSTPGRISMLLEEEEDEDSDSEASEADDFVQWNSEDATVLRTQRT